MAVLKYHDGTGWEPVASALQGPTGDAGAVYQDNEPTDTGVLWVDTDDDGFLVVPNGGATGAVLTKQSSADYDTGWDLPVNSGLVHIETQNWTATTSISFNNVFSADYTNYLIVANNSTSVVHGLTIRLRNAGSDLSSGLYRFANHYVATNADHLLETGNTQTSMATSWGNINRSAAKIFIHNPFESINTQFVHQGGGGRDATVFSVSSYGSGEYDATTSVDGITLIYSQSGDGQASIYGMKK